MSLTKPKPNRISVQYKLHDFDRLKCKTIIKKMNQYKSATRAARGAGQGRDSEQNTEL